MELAKIEELLAKYWECETSLEEEEELKKFFNGEEVPEKWLHIKPLFQYYTEEKATGVLGDSFDEQLLVQLHEEKHKYLKPKGKVIPMFRNIARVAAVALIVITAGYFVKEEYQQKKNEFDPYLTDTFEDPNEAFEETKKALQMISKNFNKGRKEVRKLSTFNEAQEKVKEDNQL